MRTIDVWNARLDVDTLLARPHQDHAAQGDDQGHRQVAQEHGRLGAAQADRGRGRQAPLPRRPADPHAGPGSASSTTSWTGSARSTRSTCARCRPTGSPSWRKYSFVDIAHKVVGVGSVGTRAVVLLLESGDGEPLLLQVKQANPSVLEPYLGREPVRQRGQAGRHRPARHAGRGRSVPRLDPGQREDARMTSTSGSSRT